MVEWVGSWSLQEVPVRRMGDEAAECSLEEALKSSSDDRLRWVVGWLKRRKWVESEDG